MSSDRWESRALREISGTPLNEFQARSICAFAELGISHKRLARRYGLKEKSVDAIVAGRRWKYLKKLGDQADD